MKYAYDQVALVMYDERMYQGRGHLVFDWGVRIENNFVRWAKWFAPVRSGELKAGIFGETTRTGPRRLQVIIESTAPHSIYVIKGTQGPIMSDKGWAGLPDRRGKGVAKMRVRAGKGYPTSYLETVSGQASQDFMSTAGYWVSKYHPSIKGFQPDVTFYDAT
jgi:hypothetical protein